MSTLRIATTTAAALSAFLLSATEPACVEDHTDRLFEACARGDKGACEEIRQRAEQHRAQLEKLNRRADAFQARSKDLAIQSGRIPDLRKAYPLAIKDYFASDVIAPTHHMRGWNDRLLAACSQDFHEFWMGQRKEWPTDSSGQPDWATIYLQILDHYFGHCSR